MPKPQTRPVLWGFRPLVAKKTLIQALVVGVSALCSVAPMPR